MFDAYYKWLGIPPEEQPPDHYRLLGLARFESNPEVIAAAADRQMAYLRTFQAGAQAEACQRLLNEVARARVCLLDPQKKAAYDADLRSVVAGRSTAQPVSASLAWEDAVDGISPGAARLRRPELRKRPSNAARRGRPVGRLLTVISSAGAAVAVALLLSQQIGFLRKTELAEQGDAAGQPAVQAAARPAPRPSKEAQGTHMPATRAPSPVRLPSPSVRQPPLPPAAVPGLLPTAPPRPPANLPEAPGPSLPEPKAGAVPPVPPLAPAQDLPLPAVPLESPAPNAEPFGRAAGQVPPKVSALAPPGTVPKAPEKPETPAPSKPSEATALVETAMELLARGKPKVAQEKLKEALKADRDSFHVLFALGLLEAVVLHDWENAENHFSQCAKLAPKSVSVLNNLALVRLRTNKPRLAIQNWRTALEIASPPPDEVVQNIARVCALVKNRYLVLSPENARSLDNLARKADVATKAREVRVFRYLLPDTTAHSPLGWPNPPGLAEDWCMACLGYGTVKCPDCVRGAVRSSATRVLGVDPSTGTVVTQSGTVRSRCPHCNGTGWVDCRACSGGHQ